MKMLTVGIRGRSQDRNDRRVLRTPASLEHDTYKYIRESNLGWLTSSPMMRTHALIKGVRDESINCGLASKSSRKPSNASVVQVQFNAYPGTVKCMTHLYGCPRCNA